MIGIFRHSLYDLDLGYSPAYGGGGGYGSMMGGGYPYNQFSPLGSLFGGVFPSLWGKKK